MEKLILLDHPGLILKEDFIDDLELTNYRLSKETGITQTILGEITKGKRSISPKNCIRLSRFFGMSDEFWITMQSDYDMRIARRKYEAELNQIKKFEIA